MGLGPAKGRDRRASIVRAALPCLALTALSGLPAHAQSLTPDLFNPRRGDFVAPQDLPLRRTAGLGDNTTLDPNAVLDPNADRKARERNGPAPSRIGRAPTYAVPTYGLPAARGAADAGYDSLNRKRKPPKYYPGQAKPKPPPGPGTPPPKPLPANATGRVRLSAPPSRACFLRSRQRSL